MDAIENMTERFSAAELPADSDSLTNPDRPASSDSPKAADRLRLARSGDRPTSREYIEYIFDDFFCMAGDRLHGEDAGIIGRHSLSFRSTGDRDRTSKGKKP